MTATTTQTDYRTRLLEAHGNYGPYGGMYVPEVLRANMEALAEAFEVARHDESFWEEYHRILGEFVGRATPLTPLRRLSAQLGGAQIVLKNEGLALTGAHKINHCVGQIMLAQRMGRGRVIAETGAGQHGYASATVCAHFGLPLTVYMGRKDYERQRPNVHWMTLLGAEVVPVESGDQTLNDAVIAAFQDLIAHPDDTHYLLGSAVGPYPYPILNTLMQRVVGREARTQCLELTGRLPDAVLACVGGGSNAMGIFYDFLDDAVQLIGVEAGGTSPEPGRHAAKATHGRPGVFEGYASYFLQADDGNILSTSSVSAGLDYCGLSPLLAYLKDEGRVSFTSATDAATLEALQLTARTEGLILALESAHAMAEAIRLAPTLPPDRVLLVNGSGRGEKDLFITLPQLNPGGYAAFREHLLKSPQA